MEIQSHPFHASACLHKPAKNVYTVSVGTHLILILLTQKILTPTSIPTSKQTVKPNKSQRAYSKRL